MDITNKTILITGGGSGIGFEIAKLLIEKGNKVIIVGRNEDKLRNAVALLPGVDFYKSDINDIAAIDRLISTILDDYETIDILINNAGQMFDYTLGFDSNDYKNAEEEIRTNYLSVIYLIEKMLPFLKNRPEAAIVNVTSILALAPAAGVSTYSSSKAALHSYSQSLRFSLSERTAIKVFELMPPLVNTEFSRNIGGSSGVHPLEVAVGLLQGMELDKYEIHIGQTLDFYNNFFSAAGTAFDALNP